MITITKTAAGKVKEIIKEEELACQGIRLRVVGGGCAGFNYDLYFEEKPTPMDELFVCEGVTMYVDPLSYQYLDGTEIDLSSGDLLVDVAGDITLDAGGADWRFKVDGTEKLKITDNSGIVIAQLTSNEDFTIRVNDGGSNVDAMVIDSSDGGAAIFVGGVRVPDSVPLSTGTGQDFNMVHDGSNGTIFGTTGNITIDSSDDAVGVIADKSALAVLKSVDMNRETDRDISLRATEVVITADYGVFELDDSKGAAFTLDAGTPVSA